MLAGTPADKCCLHKDVLKFVFQGWLKGRSIQTCEQDVGELWELLVEAQHQFNNRKKGRPKKIYDRVLSKKTIEEISGIFKELLKVSPPVSWSGNQRYKTSQESRRRDVIVELEIERLTGLSKKKCYLVFLAMVLWSLKNKVTLDITDEEFCSSFGLNRKTITNYVNRIFSKSDLEDEKKVKLRALHDSITERLKSMEFDWDRVSKV